MIGPSGQFPAIYADPPWRFRTYSAKGRGRSADAHYDTLSLEALRALPVRDWAAKDCVLFLWTTDPMLPRALELIEAWGFAYKTVGFYWAKLKRPASKLFFSPKEFATGLGFWTRANPEMCLLATRGHPKRKSKSVSRLVIAPRREHSRKPDEIYSAIEQLVDGPYLELFARQNRPGWEAWGTEAGLFDDGPVATRRWPSTRPREASEGIALRAASGGKN